MEWLKENAPLLFSPTFWGLTLSAFAGVVAHYAWLDQFMMETIATWILMVTGVNIVWRGASKIGGG